MRKYRFIIIILFFFVGISAASAYKYFQGHDEGVVVLMYHDFGYSNDPKIINAEVFEEQMAALAASDYDVISMDQYVDYMEGNLELEKKSVLITFDDGYEDYYSIAYPILKKYNLPATNFIIVKHTNEPNDKTLPHLTWDQMREMKQYGQSFYSHTYNHHIYLDPGENDHAALVSLKENETEEQYIGRIKSDLSYANELLVKELGEQPNIVAFPYGRYDDKLLKITKELGIDHTFNIKKGINQSTGTKQSDTAVYHRVNAGLSKISGEDLLKLIKRQ
ncbi:polysaccharide deacetylase family protein [Paenibacillus endoradicis]|uniref:polysaccharide deacetylase family protein n=1 Tax=Paenibacillus endoradicis TaxID=2972487 RepID=UPI0021594333|nr:polysaccharide deacetylase family protein [Paenibacillus endoradicis]MCR8657180.1 polysaccharide deacetylase family protein [Paenibacillus endoradicis]